MERCKRDRRGLTGQFTQQGGRNACDKWMLSCETESLAWRGRPLVGLEAQPGGDKQAGGGTARAGS